MKTQRVLICGESWIQVVTHHKGFDYMTSSSYEESVEWIQGALERSGLTVDFLPDHLAARKFPNTMEALRAYDVVILSDIGANTLLLHPDTAVHSRPTPNRLDLLDAYVRQGGGFLMVGGWVSFTGLGGKAGYGGTGVERLLPVTMLPIDDRVEIPQGFSPEALTPEHPILAGIKGHWPILLGYNRVRLKSGATELLRYKEDPIAAVWQHGEGRAGVFTSDCAPHWCPPDFLKWPGYTTFFGQMAKWLARGI